MLVGDGWAAYRAAMRTATKTAITTAGVLTATALFGWGFSVIAHDAAASHPAASTSHTEPDVIRTCEDSVRQMLKDPGSAQFSDWTAWPTGGSNAYSAKGMVNARNGFGGYSGAEPYACDATVSADTVTATARTSG